MMIIVLLTLISTQEVPDGSLFFVLNGSRVVQTATDSNVTHVGIIFNENGVPYLYESVYPKVRKVALSEKVDKINKKRRTNYVIVQPPKPYTREQIRRMYRYAESHLGRPYSIQGYTSKSPTIGEHCAEYVSNILRRGGWTFVNPPAETPASIWERYK